MPVHRDARQHNSEAESDATRAEHSLQVKSKETDTAIKTQHAIDEWLKQRAHLKTLATGWPRWDALFSQAAVFERGRAE